MGKSMDLSRNLCHERIAFEEQENSNLKIKSFTFIIKIVHNDENVQFIIPLTSLTFATSFTQSRLCDVPQQLISLQHEYKREKISFFPSQQ
jgi:hypothetical protein